MQDNSIEICDIAWLLKHMDTQTFSWSEIFNSHQLLAKDIK
jgi:hypothetical protein